MQNILDKRILVVDDSATMRMLLSMTIRKALHGISVTEAVNGLDAVRKLTAGDFDMVLTDMNMPEMDGIRLIREIRGSGRLDIPIVIITTKGEETDRDFGISLGADGYITKPVDAYALKKEILRLLTKSGAGHVS